MGSDDKKAFGTRCVHAGQAPAPVNGAVMTPIFQTSTFVQQEPGVYPGRYDYSRAGNPTRTALEANIAALEGANYGLCFSSGLAAISAVVHILSAGDHILISDDIYGGTFRMLDAVYTQFGISYSMVDMADLEATAAAVKDNTKLFIVESPTNPLLKVVDIEALCSLARSHGALSLVDNTFATPYLQTPLALGADIVIHSSTKYIGGHSDVIGGVLLCNDKELEERLYFVQKAVGAVPAPLDCFLLLRSTKTLHVRMQRQCENAKVIASFLNDHKKVKEVLYPGLPSHPQHEIAKKQMCDFGAMISIRVNADLERTKKMIASMNIFYLAESLGGVESLIEHPALMTHASLTPEGRQALGIGDNLIRISVGVEDVDDLCEDLEQALSLI